MADDWPQVRIRLLGKVVTGKTPSTRDSANFGDEFPFITIPDLNGRVFIDSTERGLSKQGARSIQSSLLPANAVMMSCIATVGKCGITTRPSFTNQQINSVICNDRVNPQFLYYCFTQLGRRLEALGSGGSVYTNVSKSRFSELTVPLPPLAEQQAIAYILGTLDDKIELNRRMNDTLEAMARAIFKSWFVDFDPVRAKAAGQQPSGLSPHIADLFPDAFEASELGETPRGWEIWRVADVGEVVCGKTPSTKIPEYYGDDVPFIRIPDMHDKIFATRTQKMLSLAGAASQEKKTLPTGSICVSCIATPGLVVITTQESQTNQQINSVIPKSPSETVFWYWTFFDLRDEIKASGSGGSVVTNLSTGRFSQLRIQSPPASLRYSYNAIVQPLFERILSNDEESDTLAALRDTLLPKLISGELRVPAAERIVRRVL